MATTQETIDNFISEFPNFNYGEPQQVGAAIVIPIIKSSGEDRDYISFEEALKANLLKFVDTGNINRVIIENTGEKDVLILAGQIISSTKSQDRVFAETCFISARESKELMVNCCQASKPISRGTLFDGTTYFQSPRNIKYCSIMTDVEHYERQSKIWNKVDIHRENLKVKGIYKSPKPTDKLEEIIKESNENSKSLLTNAKLIDDQRGVIILNNNSRIVGIEIFDSPITYKELHEKVIESYLEDIVDEKKNNSNINLKEILQNELNELFSKRINVDENKERSLFRDNDLKLNGEVLFRTNTNSKKRIVAFRAGSEEST